MMNRFKSGVEGFSDSLPVISRHNKEKGNGANKLVNLAATCKIETKDAHNAVADVRMLQNILLHFKINDTSLIESVLTWDMLEQKEAEKKKVKANKENILHKLKAFKNLKNNDLSLRMKKKIISVNISYEMMEAAYKESKFDGLCQLLSKGVTKNKKIIRKLSDYLDSVMNSDKNDKNYINQETLQR